MTFRRALFAAFSTALLCGLAWGCAAADNSDGVRAGAAGSIGSMGPDIDASITVPTGQQDAGHLEVNPLCGKVDSVPRNSCIPGLVASCGMFTPPVVHNEDAGPSSDAAVSGQAGAPGEGGSAGESARAVDPSGAGEGGASGATERGASGAGGDAATAGAAGASGEPAVTPSEYNCQVQRSASAPDEVYSACALAGPGGESAPCLTASDCQAGLGCVGDQNAGLCRKYCCQDANDCESGTYCAERPMRDATVNALPKGASSAGTSLLIPVCIHAENCDLSAPYPCTKGSECACEAGTACLVVRSDGTTTCAAPGTGKVGQACPCAWGHVCSAASGQCLQLCRTRDSSPCGSGKCQAASELPEGWGVCVGVTLSGG